MNWERDERWDALRAAERAGEEDHHPDCRCLPCRLDLSEEHIVRGYD